jgi:hypothetical protein
LLLLPVVQRRPMPIMPQAKNEKSKKCLLQKKKKFQKDKKMKHTVLI